MIARKLLPVLALALPAVVESQAPGYVGAEAPMVRVWIPGSWHFRYGAAVPVEFEVSEAAHVAVFRIDGRGHLMVLWPQRNALETAVKAGREYRITSPYFGQAAFAADYEFGQGMVIAMASSDPIDLSSLKRDRNTESYHQLASYQRPYVGGVGNIVDRIAQEVLYAPDSPYDYDVAFYTSAGGSRYGYACDTYYNGYRRPRYSTYLISSALGSWDDCFTTSLYGYYANCVVWAAFYGVYDFPFCRLSNPFWPGVNTPGPVAPPQPQQPQITMIDTIIARPVATTGTPSGTTHIVHMTPRVAESPNVTVTRWLDDDTEPVSLPSRFRKDGSASSTTGTGISTRDEGFPRRPNSGLRVGDRPERTPTTTTYMEPMREPPRPLAWRDHNRDRERDNGSSYSAPQRWERPTSTETPRTPNVDRGHTSTGTSSPTPAVMTPRTDATVTKSDGGSKASDAKGSSDKGSTERKP